jgi:hypothetical protein
MYWRKTDEDEFYWNYLEKTFSPNISKNIKRLQKKLSKSSKRVQHYKFTAYPDPGTWLGSGEYPHEGFIRAMKEYAFVALLDPTNIPEARVWSLALGVGYGAGLGITLAKGLILGPPILALIDPQHRWEGGLDETIAYQAAEAGIAGTHPNLNKDIIMGRGSWGSMV